MSKHYVSILECTPGEILADDVILNGVKFLVKDTTLNPYILEKLKENNVYDIWVYTYKDEKNITANLEKQYNNNINNIKKVIVEAAVNKTINYPLVMDITESLLKNINTISCVFEYMDSLKRENEYTYTHSINVAFYSMLIAKWLNLSYDKIKEVTVTGLIHDIGKIKIPNTIINKPGKLTYDEFCEIKKHPVLGYDIVINNNNINNYIKNSILMHHERMNGTGYPFKKNGNEIPLYSKIVAIADVFDAMTSDRVYKNGVTPFESFKMFASEGLCLFDVPILFTFLENISAYYLGMNVTLSDGTLGEIVYIPPRNITCPIIKTPTGFIDFSRDTNLKIEKII